MLNKQLAYTERQGNINGYLNSSTETDLLELLESLQEEEKNNTSDLINSLLLVKQCTNHFFKGEWRFYFYLNDFLTCT